MMALTTWELKLLNEWLKPHLNKIYIDNVRIKRTEDQRNVDIVNRVVDQLLGLMTEGDPLFEFLFSGRINTGSYYEKIRVKEPTEFDINIVLKLPFEDDHVMITNIDAPPAFAKFRLHPLIHEAVAGSHLKTFFNYNGKLLRTEIQNWMKYVTEKALGRFRRPPEVKSINVGQNGPAFTYNILLNDETKIDVDLVPVIDCTSYKLPPNIAKIDSEKLTWFLVPKPYKSATISDGGSDTYWRISYPQVEKQLLKNTGCVRTLIKLIKLLRDCHGWTQIYSYCITNLFLLALDENPDEYYWNEYFLGIRFFEMLGRLRVATFIGFLPYYFDEDANLFSGINAEELRNISGKIYNIRTIIQENPDCINLCFNSTIDLSSLQRLLVSAFMRQEYWARSLYNGRVAVGEIPNHRHHPYRR